MQEDFLHYVWKLQYFNRFALTTCQGEQLQIYHPGTHNDLAGPDFCDGVIVINNVSWYGHIEIHINASDWYTHRHHTNKAYDNVILHVVWNHDREVQQQDGTIMPTLVLKDRIAPKLQKQYHRLIHNNAIIPCAKQLPQVTTLLKTAMLDKALFQRLTHKNSLVCRLLEGNKGDWEETAYQLLCYNFGFKINSSTFLDLALSLPLKILAKHTDSLLHIEALLLGQASLLPTNDMAAKDVYLEALTREHSYLAHKYQLRVSDIQASRWHFFRLRPANFPTIRIAQLAQLIHQHTSIFDLLVKTSTKILSKKLAITQSSYWQKHYRYAQQSSKKIPGLGKASIEHILINTAVPLLIAYGKGKDDHDYIDRAVAILQHLPAEHNAIIHRWKTVGIKAENAFDSQALIELFNNFCAKKQCLSCNIGVSIMQTPLVRRSD